MVGRSRRRAGECGLRRLLAEMRANRVYPTAYRAVRRVHRRVMDGELVSAGLIASDGFAGLRGIIGGGPAARPA